MAAQSKTQKTHDNAAFSANVKDSAQQIWLAGLGAFTKAQEEGTRVFDALVKEGTAMQRKTHQAAEEKLTEATQRMTTMAQEMGSRATGQWDKLESIFEERVAKALHRLGMPSAAEVQALRAQVETLNQTVKSLASKPRTSAAVPTKKVARKSSRVVK
jgi:poly(hydroxyalkanoate) granule-associated protein